MKRRDLLLWISVLAGPIVWLASFEARFALVYWACTFGSKLALFGVLIAALALCGCAALIGWREWKALGEHAPSQESGVMPRANFMAIGGLVLSCGCGLILVAQFIPDLMLGACQ